MEHNYKSTDIEFPNQRIVDREMGKEVRQAFLEYSMSVITSRALPDVRDGMKPVHRRVLFGMEGLGLTWSSQTKKSARIVCEV